MQLALMAFVAFIGKPNFRLLESEERERERKKVYNLSLSRQIILLFITFYFICQRYKRSPFASISWQMRKIHVGAVLETLKWRHIFLGGAVYYIYIKVTKRNSRELSCRSSPCLNAPFGIFIYIAAKGYGLVSPTWARIFWNANNFGVSLTWFRFQSSQISLFLSTWLI